MTACFREGDVARCSHGERYVIGVGADISLRNAVEYASFLRRQTSIGCWHERSAVELLRRPVRVGDVLIGGGDDRVRRVVRVDTPEPPVSPDNVWFVFDDGSGWNTPAVARSFTHIDGIRIDGGPEYERAVREHGEASLEVVSRGAAMTPRHLTIRGLRGRLFEGESVVYVSGSGRDDREIGRAIETGRDSGWVVFKDLTEKVVDEIARACFGIDRFPNLGPLSRATAHFMADLFALGVEAWPLWRTDPEVIATVEVVADHRIGGRVSNGRLGRAYVRAWRSDHGGYRTKWMKRALDARAWRKTG